MGKVLLVSSTERGISSLSSLLQESRGAYDVTISHSGVEARRTILDNDWDLVVINAPLCDESGEQLACMVTERTLGAAIMVVRTEYLAETEAQVQDHGVLVVTKPLVRQVFFQTLNLARALSRRLANLKDENQKLQKKIEEIKVVDRAKWTLIRNLGMDEQQAHRYIEKQAMDLRKSRLEIASSILKTYP